MNRERHGLTRETLRAIPVPDLDKRVIVICHHPQRLGEPETAFSCGACGQFMVIGEAAKMRPFAFKCRCGTCNEV